MAAGWGGQETILGAQYGEVNLQTSINFDSQGRPWVFWMSRKPDYTWVLEYTQWNGTGWNERVTVPYSLPGSPSRLRFAIAPGDSIWLVFNQSNNGVGDIYYQRGQGGNWEPPQRLHAPNTRQDYAPYIGVGGGQVWVTWYGYDDDVSYPKIYVSRWLGDSWAPETEVSAGIPGYHWFSNLAVSPHGIAHVVWGEIENRFVYYMAGQPDGSWSTPFIINPPMLGVAAGSWTAPSLAVDAEGTVHVVWVGRRVNEDLTLEDWDIFYSSYDGQTWTSPVQVNSDNQTQDAYPSIAVGDPGDMWITWYDGDPASTARSNVKAIHWDGSHILQQTRLDAAENWANGVPDIALDSALAPWVVWETIGENYSPGEIVMNRYDPSVPVVLTNFQVQALGSEVSLSWWAESRWFDRFLVERAGKGTFEPISEILENGRLDYVYTDIPGPGTWKYRVAAWRSDGTIEMLGPISILVSEAPRGLELQLGSLVRSDRLEMSVGLPQSGAVSVNLVDVAGRSILSQAMSLPAGWSHVTIHLPRIAKGLYLVSLSTPSERSTRKVLIGP